MGVDLIVNAHNLCNFSLYNPFIQQIIQLGNQSDQRGIK